MKYEGKLDCDASPPIIVAFHFFNDGSEWHGGANYFRSLLSAITTFPDGISPIALIGKKSQFNADFFPVSMKVFRDSTFDRFSAKWLLNKTSERLFGRPLVTNRITKKVGASVLSHGSPTCDKKIKAISWIPDFQHLHLPEFFSNKELKSRNKYFLKQLEKSDLIIVSSEAALKDLGQFYPQYEDKARILRFCAVKPEIDIRNPLDLKATYGIIEPFFYIPNQIWAHKNHLTAIKALELLVNDFPDLKIYCSGSISDYRNPGHFETLKSEISKRQLEDKFIFLGTIPYRHIHELMLSAVAVINPSFFEGWSTTVEEAKSIGARLIVSALSVHKEQCSSGEAIFVEAGDPNDLAAAMRERMREPVIAIRSEEYQKACSVRHALRTEGFAKDYVTIVEQLERR